jgi:hypothetical protein
LESFFFEGGPHTTGQDKKKGWEKYSFVAVVVVVVVLLFLERCCKKPPLDWGNLTVSVERRARIFII